MKLIGVAAIMLALSGMASADDGKSKVVDVGAAKTRANRMTDLEAARLDAALGHVRDWQRQMEEAKKNLQESLEEAEAILKPYGLSLGDLVKGAASVNLKTGEIARAPAPAPKQVEKKSQAKK